MPAIADELAPSGTLRVGVWTVPYFAFERSGRLEGIVPDLGGELARQAGVAVELFAFQNPGKLIEAFRNGALDVTFVGITVDRAEVIEFGPVVLELQTSFLLPGSSTITSIAEIDRPGLRIAVPARSAQEAHLRKTIAQATLVPVAAETPQVALDMLTAGEADAFSHVTAMLATVQPTLSGSRVLPGSYYNVPIAIGTARGRPHAVAAYARELVERLISSGFVQEAIVRSGIKGALIGGRPHALSSDRFKTSFAR